MRKSLYAKFLLGYLLFGLIGFTAISTISANYLTEYLQRLEASSLYQQANVLASRCSEIYEENISSKSTIEAQLEGVPQYLDARVWIMNASGTVLYDEEGDYAGRTISQFDPIDFAASYRIDTFYDTFSEEQISVCVPIAGRFSIYGYIVILKSISSLSDRYYGALNQLYIAFALIYFSSLILLWIFSRYVHRPLKKITEGTNQYASGNLDYHIEVENDDEIGRLADTLNYMAKKLEDMEDYQRKFVSNVSHDFRSPLTSINGYIEAMLDGTIPPENQEKYLKIVSMETERLNKLTQNLLTLNSIGEKGTYLDLSAFDINQVIKSICETFEGICMEKNITFDLTFSEAQLFVYADMGKIQQVLYNLIDNALKFSHENSTIWIEAYQNHGKIFVSVKDAGVGIPKDSLSKIWERFYKTDPSRGKDKRGTGLGLSIVKEIIQAHEENIDVISTEGVGTQFIFSLPLPPEEKGGLL